MTDIYTSVAITGVTPTVLDYRLRLYLSQIDDGGGDFHTAVYNDAALSSLVAHTAPYSSAGEKNLIEDNSSGIGGTVTVSDYDYARAGVVVHYGRWSQIGALTSSLLTVVGRALNEGTVPYLWYSPDPHRVQVVPLGLPSTYATATEADALRDTGRMIGRWDLGDAHLACYRTAAVEVHGSSEPRINVLIDGAVVSTKNSSEGWEVSTSAATWVTATDLTAGLGILAMGSTIDVGVTIQGAGSADDKDLTVQCVVVLE